MKVSVTLTILFLSVAAYAQPFVTTWKTDNDDGVSGNTQIIIPTTSASSNYDVHWEEVGVPANNGDVTGLSGSATINFPVAGTYRVEISGAFSQIKFATDPTPTDGPKLLTVEQWGSIAWSSMRGAFASCSNLKLNAIDNPNLTNVTDMTGMFQQSSFNDDIGDWDVSNVTNMSFMFMNAIAFNQDLSAWDVSNVTDMSFMFYDAEAFNSDISTWNVSSVTDMSSMFAAATVFNQPIGSWDVSNVTNMDAMFASAPAFNRNIGSWDVGGVTNMEAMFLMASAFNQNIGGWDVSNVTDMIAIFFQATSFNQPIGAWNVSGITDMTSFFFGATAFNQPIGAWNTSNVTNMNGMFYQASAFNQDLSTWDVSHVTNMGFTFREATAFNENIDNWDVSNVTDMRNMFYQADAFNRDIGNWNVGNVTNMSFMFLGTDVFNQDLDGWDVSNVATMASMFSETSSFNGNIGSWNVSSVANMNFMLSYMTTFNQDIGNWDVSNVTDMAGMFASSVFNQDITNWNVNSLQNMGAMFYKDSVFSQDISGWDVGNVTDMNSMFQEAISFDINLSAWDFGNVIDMTDMLDDSGITLPNYDAFLISVAQKDLNTNVSLGAASLEYCQGAAARATLISRGWTIDGDSDGCIIVPELLVPDMNIVRSGNVLTEGASVTFSNTGVGLVSNLVFRIRNKGNGTLVISDVQVTGDAFGLIGEMPTQIEPGDSTILTIKFAPSNLGSHTGTVSIFSNDDVPVYTLNISGEGDADVEVYNVVTPNPNGKHDFLNIRNIELFPNNQVTVYDRWGNQVFEKVGYNNIDETFAGNSNADKSLPDGTYYYVIDKNNGSAKVTGFLLLRR